MSIDKRFNNKLFDFLDDLKSVIGELPEYGILSSSARLLGAMNPSRNRQVFATVVVSKYGERIVARDESFFLDTEFTGVSGSGTPNVVDMLKNVWGQLCAADKEAIWDHLNVLVALNARA